MSAPRKPESKTSLACDRCRRRKSRCDGARPRCAHCSAAGHECHYRPTPTTLESDTAFLSRLSKIEERLLTLESIRGDPLQLRSLDAVDVLHAPSSLVSPPSDHTASAQLMLHSWPRLKLCLPQEERPLSFLADADGQDASFTVDRASLAEARCLEAWQVTAALEAFHHSQHQAPLLLQLLLEACEEFRPDRISPPDHDCYGTSLVVPDSLALTELMGICLALMNHPAPGHLTQRAAVTAYFNSILQRQWTLWNSVHGAAMGVAIAYCLVTYWARPFHALGALHAVTSSLRRGLIRAGQNSRLNLLAMCYYVIESDLLSEVDEFSSDTVLSSGVLLEAPGFPSLTGPADGLLWLRSHMNKILHLYTPTRAYARPHELAELVFGLDRSLREWYQSLALETQFPRDIVTFTIHQSTLPSHSAQRDIALRYFSCVFLLHRPVLYFFLHQDMEYAIQPPLIDGAVADHGPWVSESCRSCIESAGLLVLCSSPQNAEVSRYWPEYQLLFASYLVLLQTRADPSLEPYVRILGNVEHLLDAVEGMFRVNTPGSPLLEASLSVLLSTRRSFETA